MQRVEDILKIVNNNRERGLILHGDELTERLDFGFRALTSAVISSTYDWMSTAGIFATFDDLSPVKVYFNYKGMLYEFEWFDLSVEEAYYSLVLVGASNSSYMNLPDVYVRRAVRDLDAVDTMFGDMFK